MVLKEQLSNDLKQALKAGDQLRAGVLRFLNAAIHNKEIEKRTKTGSSELNDAEVNQVLISEAKKRKEAAELYLIGKREDLAGKEQKELAIIQNYLPQELAAGEIKKLIAQILSRAAVKDFGQAMKIIMPELKGRADAKLVSEFVREFLK